MLILVRKENAQGQAHIFQDKYFESSQMHHLTIVYLSEGTNHYLKIFTNSS